MQIIYFKESELKAILLSSSHMITGKKRWGPCLAIPTRLHAIMEERETFSKKNKSISSKEGGGLIPGNFKTHYRAIGIKTVSYLYAVRSTDQ